MSQGMGPSPFVLQTPVDPPQSTAATAKTATNANTATRLRLRILLLLLYCYYWCCYCWCCYCCCSFIPPVKIVKKGYAKVANVQLIAGLTVFIGLFFERLPNITSIKNEYQSWSIMYKRMVSDGTFHDLPKFVDALSVNLGFSKLLT